MHPAAKKFDWAVIIIMYSFMEVFANICKKIET